MKKILIFSDGEKIGDGLIKLPFLQEIFLHFKNSKITWLAYGTTVYSTTMNKIASRYLNEVICNSDLNVFPWQKISNSYDFQNKFYDIIIDTQKTVYKTIALKRIKSKIFVSSTASWLFSDLKPKNNYNKNKYYLENLFDMLSLITNKKVNHINNYLFPQKLETDLKNIFKNQKPCIGVAPGAGEKDRKWKIENFLKVSKYFMNKGYSIAFFVGPNDLYEKYIILKTFPNAFFPEDLIKNHLGLEVVMCSTKHLICSLSNDTGTGHMLSTNFCPLLKLFSKNDPVKFTPKSGIIKTINSQEYDSNDINSIPVKEVVKSIEDLILTK